MTIIDLYTEKYLGELETTIIEKDSSNQVVFEVHLFSADFSSIIGWIPFNKDSNSESLVYLFNMNVRWGKSETQIARLQEFYEQMLSITNQVQSLDLPVLNALKQITLSAIQNGNNLFIEHE